MSVATKARGAKLLLLLLLRRLWVEGRGDRGRRLASQRLLLSLRVLQTLKLGHRGGERGDLLGEGGDGGGGLLGRGGAGGCLGWGREIAVGLGGERRGGSGKWGIRVEGGEDGPLGRGGGGEGAGGAGGDGRAHEVGKCGNLRREGGDLRLRTGEPGEEGEVRVRGLELGGRGWHAWRALSVRRRVMWSDGKIVKYVRKQRDDTSNIIAYLDALSGTESAMESGLEPRDIHPALRHPSSPSPTHVGGKCAKTWDFGDDSIRSAHIQAVTTKRPHPAHSVQCPLPQMIKA